MKKIILISLILLSVSGFSQTRRIGEIILAADSTVTFSKAAALGTVVFNDNTNQFYKLTAFTPLGTVFSAASKYLVSRNGLYTGSDTIPSNTVALIVDSLLFDGNVKIGETLRTDNILFGSGSVATITDNLTFGNNDLFINSTNNRVGIGNISPQSKLDIKVSGFDGIRISNGVQNLDIGTGYGIPEFKTNAIGFQFTMGAGGRHVRFNHAASGNTIFYLNGANNTGFDFANGTGAANHSFNTQGANVGRVQFNRSKAATGDFQVNGDNDSYLFFTDASNDNIGIGLNAPTAKLHVQGNGSTSGSTNTFFANSLNQRLLSIKDNGYTVLGVANTPATNAAVTLGVGHSNGAVVISAGDPNGTNNVVSDNTSLSFAFKNDAGLMKGLSQIWVRPRSLVNGSQYGAMVLNNSLMVENSTGYNGTTTVSSQGYFTNGNANATLGVMNMQTGVSSSFVIATNQNSYGLAFSILSTNRNTWNWRLKDNHEFEHNYAQLTTGDFKLRGGSDAFTFFMDASSDRVGIGTATPLEKLHSTAKVRADTGFNYNGNDGITETITFGGGSTGDIATLTIEGGIITGKTLVP